MTTNNVLFLLLSALISLTNAFNVPTRTTFATYGNAETKELLKLWQPKPLSVGSGQTMLPSSQENMKRYVRARILLEDPSLGCVASCDDNLSIILCRFSRAEHQLLLPLWQPSAQAQPIFKDLVAWHQECFGKEDGPRLSGSKLESERSVWNDLGFGI
jgi:hypothetical protein